MKATSIALKRAILALTLTLATVECVPVPGSLAPSAPTSASNVEDLLRLYNVSREDIEASRQQHLAAHQATNANHHHPHFQQSVRQRQHQQQFQQHQQHQHQLDMPMPISASSVQKALRNRSHANTNKSSSAAMQRKHEVFRQVMGFVSQNGRPLQMPSAVDPPFTSPSVPAPFPRPEATSDSYSHGSVGRIRYIQPSCDIPKHADEEVWSSGSTSSSLHLFFNLSGIQSQTRAGYQLYVIGAKLRLLKFPEGEAQPSTNLAAELAELGSVSGNQEPPIQSLRPAPFFDPLTPPDEEKVRVSVHNYTRPLKRNRVHKKKLLDSQMALAREEGYMELDIKLAARWWLATGGRNYGLSLEVEDTDGQRKPATRFFRPRNCSSDGSIRTDELTDPADVVSPVLELTIVEVPEGRNVFEIPSSIARSRSTDDTETVNEELESVAEGADDTPRKHRHHTSRVHASHEEQADEAFVRVHHLSRNGLAPSSSANHGKHRASHRTNHYSRDAPRPTTSPVPTLATLEDHDLFRETEEEETARAEADELRMMRQSSIFMQRMLQHQHQQQQQQSPHPRRGKENRRMAY